MLVRDYRAITGKMKDLESRLAKLNTQRRALDLEIKQFKGVLQSTIDERTKLGIERLQASILRVEGLTYEEIAAKMGLSNATMARNRVIQFNKLILCDKLILRGEVKQA